MSELAPLLDVRYLAVHAPLVRGLVRDRVVDHRRVVDGVSLQIARGETYGLVGESGSGASLVGRAVVRLVQHDGGRVLFDGIDTTPLRGEPLRTMRRRFQMVFTDPRSGLDPRRPVESLLVEGMQAHRLVQDVAGGRRHARELAEAVGLPAAALAAYPHELTDLQRRRVGIAAALSVGPELLVVDEPVAALDVSAQAHVLNLLTRLRAERELSYLVISRDVTLVRHLSDRIGVMYLGGIVEEAPAAQLHRSPLHPYTRALLSAVPVPDPEVADRRERVVLTAVPGEPGAHSTGCRFHPSCPWRQPRRCADERPQLRAPAGAGSAHRVACHFAEEIRRGTLRPHSTRASVMPVVRRHVGR